MRQLVSLCRRYGSTAALLIAALLLLQSSIFAQQTGTITGTVFDTTGAVIPGAKVILLKAATKDPRSTISNNEGYFTFPGLTPGDYNVTAEAKGFRSLGITGIHVLPGDRQYVSGLKLPVGNQTEIVTVEATGAAVVTVDSPERSSTITSAQIERLGTNGRNATELLKILPGFAIRGGNKVNNVPGYDSNQQSMFNSATSSFGANGMPPQSGGVSLTSDGAQIIDPGDMGASVATINMDMVQEVKVQTSNFGADTAKGPVVINAVGKSGSEQYHGSLYTYVRDGSINSLDAYLKSNGQKKPDDRYVYPGGNIGGPVNIPGTNLKKKMFFFGGYEYYRQTIPFNNPISAQVPTAGQRNGDFSWDSVSPLCAGQMPQGWHPYTDWTDPGGTTHTQVLDNQGNGPSYCQTPTHYYNAVTQTMTQLATTHGDVSPFINAGGAAFMKLFPMPNVTPTAANGWSNYIFEPVTKDNSWQARGRLDYNFNENNKIYGSYNVQKEGSPSLQAIYWAPGSAIQYPGNVSQQMKSNSISLNYLRIFSPSFTNEAKASLVLFNGPFTLTNPDSVSRTGLGFPYKGVFQNENDQIPGIVNWYPGGYPMIYMQGGFDNGSLESRKTSYNLSDDVVKLIGTHTLKAGFYYERTANGQFQFAQTNGSYQFGDTWRYEWSGAGGNANGWQGCSGSNPVCFNNSADLLMGLPTSYSQDAQALSASMYFKNISFYGSDSWKVSKRLTLDLGLRFEYVGPWTDARGNGFAVFDQALYNKQAVQDNSNGWYTTKSTVQYPGMVWHATDSTIPLSGAPNHAPFISPRVGLAWDIFGTGTTVVRGGFGMYRWHDSYNPYAGALNPGLGQKSVSISGAMSFASIDALSSSYASGQFGPDGSAYFVDRKDTQQPLTKNWNLTISRQMPWSSYFEVGYVGNESTHLIPPGQLTSVNIIPMGSLYSRDLPSAAVDSNVKGLVSNLTTNQLNQYRPYSWYGETLQTTTHKGWANYHAMQASWNRQKGWATFGLNYTFSKALGLFTDANPLNIHDDYGPLGIDRTHAFNAAYSFDLGHRITGNPLLRGILNNWMLSGVTGYQSGFSIQSANDSNSTGFSFGGATIMNTYNYDATASVTAPNATVYYVPVNSSNLLGTPDVTLQPNFSCDPTQPTNGVKNSFMNTNCYSAPDFLQNASVYKGYFHSPAYFNSDLTIAKSFNMGEKRQLQFRASAFNFLNHPLLSFNESNKNNLSLTLSNSTVGQYCPKKPGDANAVSNCYVPGQNLVPVDFANNQNSANNTGFVGQAVTKFGRRTILLGVKFDF